MSKPAIFSVANHHIASCGQAPEIDDGKPGQYRGYFENEYGEQALFVYDRATKKAALYMGDADWGRPLPVVDGRVPHFVFTASEQRWLDACWAAATTVIESQTRQ